MKSGLIRMRIGLNEALFSVTFNIQVVLLFNHRDATPILEVLLKSRAFLDKSAILMRISDTKV